MTTPQPDARRRILDAFATYLLKQPYDRLSISELLRRADVGRTTFYAHFRDKEELFEVSVTGLGDALIQASRNAPRPWGFLRPLLSHVDSHRGIYSGFVGRVSVAVLERQMRRLFWRLIADDLARRSLAVPDAVGQAAMVGALWALLLAWIERRIDRTPQALADETARILDALAAR